MKRMPHLRWLPGVLLVALPVALYANTLFHRYGFRDDYSVLRESLQEPGKVQLVANMQGRPLYGLLLQSSFAHLRGIDDLQWLRLASALLLGSVAASVFALLRRRGWDATAATLLAALLVVLPSAQVVVSWTVAWPLNVAALLALAAFLCADRAFGDGEEARHRGGRNFAWWSCAVLLVAASGLLYQPNSLFYFVGVAAAWWPTRQKPVRESVEWLGRHFVTAGLGLAVAFTASMVAFAQGWTPMSHRVALESHWLAKLAWFVASPLENALALVALNDDRGAWVAVSVATLTTAVLLTAVGRTSLRDGWRAGLWFFAALVLLLGASFSVNLLVADRWPAYRVLFPLAAVVAIFVAVSVRVLGGLVLTRVALGALFVAGAWLARRQAFELFARPQGVELALLEHSADRVLAAGNPPVFVVYPGSEHVIAPRVYGDEFGSLSTNSDWVPKEMLKLILRERTGHWPAGPDERWFATGRQPPRTGSALVIDLRRRLGAAPVRPPLEPAPAAAIVEAGPTP